MLSWAAEMVSQDKAHLGSGRSAVGRTAPSADSSRPSWCSCASSCITAQDFNKQLCLEAAALTALASLHDAAAPSWLLLVLCLTGTHCASCRQLAAAELHNESSQYDERLHHVLLSALSVQRRSLQPLCMTLHTWTLQHRLLAAVWPIVTALSAGSWQLAAPSQHSTDSLQDDQGVLQQSRTSPTELDSPLDSCRNAQPRLRLPDTTIAPASPTGTDADTRPGSQATKPSFLAAANAYALLPPNSHPKRAQQAGSSADMGTTQAC